MSAQTGNKASIQDLNQLFSALTVAATPEDVNQATNSLASFVNGPIEEQQYVYPHPSLAMVPEAVFFERLTGRQGYSPHVPMFLSLKAFRAYGNQGPSPL